MVNMIRNNGGFFLKPSWQKEMTPPARKILLLAKLKLNMLTLGFAFASALKLAACGGEIISTENDGGRQFINDAGQPCLIIDRFEDSNLISESMNASWSAIPGSRIVTSNKVLRVEGQRTATDGYMGIELTVSASPFDTKDYDTFFVDARVGSTSDPSTSIAGKLKLEASGNSSSGFSTNKMEIDLLSGEFKNEHLVYGANFLSPDLIIQSLVRLGIYFQTPDDAEYFLEIKNAELCKTSWNFLQ